MSRKRQDQNYQSGHHQTSYPYPPQQHGQFPQPPPNTYNDRPPSHHAHPSYPEGSLQHPPSGQGYGSRSPYAAPVPFPEPQYDGSASHPQAHIPPSQTTQNLTVATHHQHERRGSHGHSPATGWSGSSSDGQRLYPAGTGSDTGGGSKFYSGQPGVEPHHGGGYTATAAQPQDWNAAVYNEGHDSRSNAAGHGGIQGHGPRSIAPGVPPVGSHRRLRPQVENAAVYDEGHGSRPKSPPHHVTSGYKPLCRYPRCGHHVFFDRRVNELREWCSDQHMQDAIMHRVEKPCNTCRVWPRRNGYKLCSGNVCRYPGY